MRRVTQGLGLSIGAVAIAFACWVGLGVAATPAFAAGTCEYCVTPPTTPSVGVPTTKVAIPQATSAVTGKPFLLEELVAGILLATGAGLIVRARLRSRQLTP